MPLQPEGQIPTTGVSPKATSRLRTSSIIASALSTQHQYQSDPRDQHQQQTGNGGPAEIARFIDPPQLGCQCLKARRAQQGSLAVPASPPGTPALPLAAIPRTVSGRLTRRNASKRDAPSRRADCTRWASSRAAVERTAPTASGGGTEEYRPSPAETTSGKAR